MPSDVAQALIAAYLSPQFLRQVRLIKYAFRCSTGVDSSLSKSSIAQTGKADKVGLQM